MPCHDYHFDPPNFISQTTVEEVSTLIFGLTSNNPLNEDSIASVEREALSNYDRLEKYKKQLRRAFIFCIRRSEAGDYMPECQVFSGIFIPNRSPPPDHHHDPLLRNHLVDVNFETCKNSIYFWRHEGKSIKSGTFLIPATGLVASCDNEFDPTSGEKKKALLEKWMSLILLSGFTMNKKLTKKSPFNKLFSILKKKNQSCKSLCEVDNIMCCIFEFIESAELINTVASVCRQFHELIIFNNQAGNQIFGGRMLYYFKKKKLNLNTKDLKNLMMFHQSQSWIELYLMSGMIFLEYFENEMYQNVQNLISTNFEEMQSDVFFILDPLLLIENKSISNLLEKKKKKIISVLVEYGILYEKVTNRIPFPETRESFLKSVIFSPLLTRPISFEKGIPLYLQFLKDLTSKLENAKLIQQAEKSRIFQYVSQKILEKAKHFLNQSKFEYFDYAPDDVLLGLHFILLDDYYINNSLTDMVHLNFSTLLENREKSSTNNFKKCEFPKDLQPDYLQILISGDIELPSNHQFDPSLFFPNSNQYLRIVVSDLTQQVNSLKLFLQEHIFDLSTVNVCDLQTYLTFLKRPHTSVETSPTKEEDLYYHFHMLHSIFFYQDCKEIAQVVRNHVLGLPYKTTIIPRGEDYSF